MSKWHLSRLFILIMILPLLIIIPGGCRQSNTTAPAFVYSLEGDVQIKIANTTNWIKAEVNAPLGVSDIIKTGADSKISITFFDGSTIEMKANTWLEVKELAEGVTKTIRLKQEIGETLSRVEKLLDSASRYEVETPVAVAGVRGSQMIVEVAVDGTTSVGNVEGIISVTAQGKEVIIPEGKHSTVIPGAAPGQPTEGTTSLIISNQSYTDSSGDLFDTQNQPVSGPGYLDIQTSRISFIDGKWFLRMGLDSVLPAADTVTANTLVEWNFLLDFDRNQSTGLSRPFIGNDIGYDYLVQLSLNNNVYTCHLIDLTEGTSEAIDFVINDKNIEMVIQLTSSGDTAIISPPSFNWVVAAIYYKDEDPRDQPSFADKAPNEGHYVFTPSQTGYSAVDDYFTGNGNPNGAWSYGWMPTDFGIFNIYTSRADSAFNRYAPPDLISWYEGLGGDRTPCVWINTGDMTFGTPDHWLSLHPGPGEEPSVIRWTAPAAGNIQISGEFLPGDSGKMTVAVRHNNREIWNAIDYGSFDRRIDVNIGDTLDFMVYGGYWSGNTPVRVNISYMR